jgi:protein-tyrosine phosphatase
VHDVFWIAAIENSPALHLAIVLRPRGDDWLEDELLRYKTGGVQTLVSMLEGWEAEQLGLAAEERVSHELGISFLSYPIPDRGLPSDLPKFQRFVGGLADRLKAGEHVGIHCRGSIGRSTIAGASTLIHLGWSPAEALAAVEKTRGCPVPDTPEQRDWILKFEARS